MGCVTVLGAGVVGLSTAIRLLEKKFDVNIIAEFLPGDKKTIEYTSPWAGAHHVSRAEGNKVQLGYDKRTFEVMWEMSDTGHPAAGCFMRLHQAEHFINQDSATYSPYGFMPGYKSTQNESGSKVTIEFETVTIDTSVYLPYLLSTFIAKGGKIFRSKVGHLMQVAEGSYTSRKPDLIVVCTGIGSRSLGGVEDLDVYPVRGQTVLIRAPWVKFGISEKTPECISYIIPRQSGDVVIGGTYGVDDWYPHPRPETIDDIIRRALALSPLIAPPESRENGRTPTVEDVRSIMIETGCGLRPARKGGIRLEMGSAEYMLDGKSHATPLVFNYGHGGQGYQSSWGTAERAVEIVVEVLRV
ncbi:nucleotide-binding domain-containing protein [Ceratobasidium sp. AG-I]|nr:nucleotide-binding domain-containing protein [Ceratobasidium sp. AG-I]